MQNKTENTVLLVLPNEVNMFMCKITHRVYIFIQYGIMQLPSCLKKAEPIILVKAGLLDETYLHSGMPDKTKSHPTENLLNMYFIIVESMP